MIFSCKATLYNARKHLKFNICQGDNFFCHHLVTRNKDSTDIFLTPHFAIFLACQKVHGVWSTMTPQTVRPNQGQETTRLYSPPHTFNFTVNSSFNLSRPFPI